MVSVSREDTSDNTPLLFRSPNLPVHTSPVPQCVIKQHICNEHKCKRWIPRRQASKGGVKRDTFCSEPPYSRISIFVSHMNLSIVVWRRDKQVCTVGEDKVVVMPPHHTSRGLHARTHHSNAHTALSLALTYTVSLSLPPPSLSQLDPSRRPIMAQVRSSISRADGPIRELAC